MRTKLIAGILILALVATSIGAVSARNWFGVQSPMSQLTEEEREEVLQQMQVFKQQICDQYNISCPGGPLGNLTEEQREEVRQKVQEFRQKQIEEAQEFWQELCDQYNIPCPCGPKFVDGINDNIRPHGWRYWRAPGFR